MAMRKVEERLEEVGADDFSAWFTSALAVAWPDGPAVVVEGRVDGDADLPAARRPGLRLRSRSSRRKACDQTFGEMDPAAKDGMSHRARAFEKLKAALF